MIITVALPWPAKQLFPNFKNTHHWRRHHSYAKAYRRDAFFLARAAGVRPGMVPAAITITFHQPNRIRRDDDGMIGAIKAGRDGIADALGTDDHGFRPAYVFGDVVKGGQVLVELHIAEAVAA